MTHRFMILDVFAEAQFAGNQLGVVFDADDLSTEDMQTIALETNFSETTFVTGRTPTGAWSTRIFTPTSELPFAGHPTLGTAWALRSGGEATVTLALAAGDVGVSFDDATGLGWITPPAPEFRNEIDHARIAAVLGLPVSAMDTSKPAIEAVVGPEFLLAPLRSREALYSIEPDVAAWRELAASGTWAFGLFPFTLEASDDSDYAARMLFPAHGVREDPATGSANTCFAAWLARYAPPDGIVTVAQGEAIDRPSRLYLDCGSPLRVGGRVFASVAGELLR